MKLHKRAAPLAPIRSPFQDHQAEQRRMVWVERLGKFAVALFFLALLLGQLGNGAP
jgi:hypothetical protein